MTVPLLPPFPALCLLSLATGGALYLGAYLFYVRHGWSETQMSIFVAGGAGFILSVTFLEMIPDMSAQPYFFYWVLGGFGLIHLFEHVLPAHFHYGEEHHHDAMVKAGAVPAIVLGLVVHNYFTGVALGAGVSMGVKLGTLIFLGAIIHKLPEGFMVASVAGAAGTSRKTGMLIPVLLFGAILAGAISAYMMPASAHGWHVIAVGLAAGSFLHVGTTDLLAHHSQHAPRWTSIFLVAGVGFFFLAEAVIGAVGLG